MQKKILVFSMLFLVSNTSIGASLSDVSFLVGCWTLQDDESRLVERWLAPGENIMVGIGKKVNKNNQIEEYQFLTIENHENNLVYTPYINGEKLASYIYNKNESSTSPPFKATFSNEANDFPKNIIYSRNSLESIEINIKLEGLNEENQYFYIEFPMFREDCNLLI